ncbi:gfo/Idh/MocA family oxidoreductase [Aquibacillus halophilus]|uniref:Gfo/Idh/MocA family oxidoreductase n=1 Tax=Aquibacillus halophilus TaxID=930132 RepID=A0A6A8D6T3_9BACI|nr:Gfo/Idh/MocA family oxidoreductase [Aquibacillus halophilus]MRH41465.1 gfo/Idh/MocA family oxidoreductase [Aquibacillus halophilus]
MKIGMIGIGDIAKKAYLPVLTATKSIELHVCTRNKQTLKELKNTYGIAHTYSQMDEWIASGIEAAFVHSSTDSHEYIIDKLLDNHIHVYVDKPITYYADSSKRLMAKAKSKGLILMVGFNRRHAPPYQKLREITEPNMVIMQKNRGNQAAKARTFIFDDFIHVIDTLLYLFPYSIENVHINGKQQDGNLQHVTLQLEAKQGTAIAIMNREAGTTEEKVEVFSQEETRRATNVNEVTSHKDRNVLIFGNNDWEPMLQKRGFTGVVLAFLESVKNGSISDENYNRDLEGHLIAEKIVQHLE